MKTTGIFLIGIFSLFIFSCKKIPLVSFDNPQPVNSKNLNEFPSKYLGQYKNPTTMEKLNIEPDKIVKTIQWDDTITTKEYFKLNKSTIKDLKKISDSLYYGTFEYSDTIFVLNDKNLLRKLKRNYFLNKNNDNNSWFVSKVNFANGYLTLSDITSQNDLELLNEISDNKTNDSLLPKLYSLDKKQFKEFIRKNGFSEVETFIKE